MRYLVFLLLLASCLSPRRVDKYLEQHPEKWVKKCADNFPCDTIVNFEWDTLNTVSIDTVNNFDTITKVLTKVKIVNKIKTIVKTQTFENTARIKLIQSQKTNDSIEAIKRDITNLKEIELKNSRIKQLNAEIYSFLFLLILSLGFIIYKQIKRV